jgi:hypothetical protein
MMSAHESSVRTVTFANHVKSGRRATDSRARSLTGATTEHPRCHLYIELGFGLGHLSSHLIHQSYTRVKVKVGPSF